MGNKKIGSTTYNIMTFAPVTGTTGVAYAFSDTI